jgi:hypothetical protein
MQNMFLDNLAQSPIRQIMRRLETECSHIFGEFHIADYQNLVAVFARLNQDIDQLNEERVEDLREFIDAGIIYIARRYNDGGEIHPGTMNILIMAIQVFNRADGHPYRFGVEFIGNISPQTEEFMEEIVQPITQNLQLFALHHAPWVNQVQVAREAAHRAREEAPGAETRIARTLAEFRAMGGHAMEAECPLCLEEFIEGPVKGRSPVFMPVVFHKDAKGKWFHPMHTVCVNDVKKEVCPMCREKVTWPKMMAVRKTRRPASSPTRKRSLTKRRSPGRRSPGNRRTPNSAGF